MFGSPTSRSLAALGIFIVAGLVLPGSVSEYYIFLGNALMMYLVLAVGLDILMGWTGQFAFAHPAFFGIGCYGTAILNIRYGIPFVVGMPISALVAGALGFMVGFPATRMRNIYLALATFAFAESMRWVFNAWDAVTGGPNGLRIPASNIFGWRIESDISAFPINSVICIVAIGAVLYLTKSRLGREMVAVRESEHVALASGINVRRIKLIAFSLSAVYAAVAGGMFTLSYTFVNAEQFGSALAIMVLSMIVVGGMGSIGGVFLGVAVLGLLPEVLRTSLRSFQIWQELVYGLILMATMMFIPRGVWHIIKTKLLSRPQDGRKQLVSTHAHTGARPVMEKGGPA